MSQLATVSTQVEIKSPAGTFYKFFKDKVPQLPQLLPEAMKSFKFLEGNEIRDGAVVLYEYDLGSTMTAKAKIEVNESSKSVKFIVVDGDILNHYNAFNVKFEMNSSGYVKMTMEFEKERESSPNPDAYVSFGSKIIKRLDAYLIST